jgi:hypothetical protein
MPNVLADGADADDIDLQFLQSLLRHDVTHYLKPCPILAQP